jgi:hypothetical protein
MKKVFLAALLFSLIISCSQNDTEQPINVQIESFNLNQNCFSAIKLQDAEVVITNASDYKYFEDSIRVNWFQSCDTITLPKIDFDSSFFVGKYTQTAGCSVSYTSQVKFYTDQNLYNYKISTTGIGTCERLNSAFNCAIVPRQTEQINVQMRAEYFQQ